jgi:hypothetical protein
MKAIIEAKMQETEIDYNLMGLYSHEEYAGRIGALKELLAILNKKDDEAMIGIMHNQKEEQEMIDARQAEENQYDPMWAAQDECCYGKLNNAGDECNCGEMNEEICGSQLEYENELAYRNKAIDENWSEEDKLKLQALRKKIANQ